MFSCEVLKRCHTKRLEVNIDCRGFIPLLFILEVVYTYECYHCGSKRVAWMNDFMFEDVGCDGDGIVSFFQCLDCGAEIEVYVSYDNEESDKEEDKNQL